MITYTAKSAIVPVSDTPTLLAAADRDRVYLEMVPAQSGVFFGGDDVSTSSGFVPSPNQTLSDPVKLQGTAATAAVYGVVSSGSIGVYVLEVVPNL